MSQANSKLHKKRNAALDCFRNGNLDEARQMFDWVVRKNPSDWEVWNMLGAINGMLGDHAQSEACCRRVLQLQPASFPSYNNLGNALKHQGKRKEAEAAYTQAIALQPNYVEAASNLGDLLREMGETERARELLHNAVRLKPDHAGAHNNLGTLHLSAGELDAAVTAYRKAIGLNPQLREATYNLGCAYMALGHYESAAEAFRRYVAVDPGNAEAWTSLCIVLSQLKHFDDALSSGERAVALSQGGADAHFVLGSAYHSMGRTEAARTEYAMAREANPAHAAAGYFLDMLEGNIPEQAPQEYVKDLFDTYAHKFDNDLTKNLEYRTPEHIGRLLHAYAPGRSDLRIMDLGCGTGLVGPLVRDLAIRLDGVDLSPKMVAMAEQKGVYDNLVVGDVLAPLATSRSAYDAVIAADVFVYIGKLDAVFDATAAALAAGGYFVFSVELESEGDGYVLRDSGRYAHTDGYVRLLAQRNGFDLSHNESVVLRQEGGKPIQGMLYVLRNGV